MDDIASPGPLKATDLPRDDDALVRLRVVRRHLGDPAASTVWKWVQEGKLPKPFKIGPRISCWRAGDIRRAAREIAGKRWESRTS